ncbi:helix-turn-helix domain-containing protein [Dyadobacter aurulentus]|uniref:helix-turn-helix domain-containing protein n=1 Tax=Dyadobacter sp. UC 10 TaxID=2605428 RepID=UPI0011F2B30C|nr:helix-turn-helix domain-containing protein [Dyadobacter sp. UC 10]KAA0993658.1 helix-turn-helix domain-containing protein [Dyadobacter sp. UC 10]
MRSSFPRLDIGPLSEYRAEDFMISRFSEYLKEHQNLVFPHRHSFYHLVLFTEGAGSHIIDFNHFQVEAGQMYFMVPGQVHDWRFEGKPEGYVVNFSAFFFNAFLLQSDYLDYFPFLSSDSRNNVLRLSKQVFEKVIVLFEELLTHEHGEILFRKDMIRVLLLQILFTVARNDVSGDAKKSAKLAGIHKHEWRNPVIRQFQKLVDRHFISMKKPGAYADLLNITPNHLNALCKEHLGVQAGEVVRARIVLEAKRLLTNQTLTISQVSDQLQFADNSYFTKFFKKETGATPEEFRGGRRREEGMKEEGMKEEGMKEEGMKEEDTQ